MRAQHSTVQLNAKAVKRNVNGRRRVKRGDAHVLTCHIIESLTSFIQLAQVTA